MPASPRIICTATSSVGSSTLTTWNRRASAGSFSKYFLYSAQVVAAIVRSSPRASAGLSRLAASPWPACPPAPIIVCASSMNRMIGVGDDFTSSITVLRRFSNSPFTPAPACSRPRSSVRKVDVLQRLGHVAGGDPQGEAFDDGRFADARLAGEDRVVLPPAREDVDHLADLGVAAEHRVDLAALGLVGEVGGELVESRRFAVSRRPRAIAVGGCRRRRLPRQARRLRPSWRRASSGRFPTARPESWPAPASCREAASKASGRSTARPVESPSELHWLLYFSEASVQASRIMSMISGESSGAWALPVLSDRASSSARD